jgi:hypothetical protein
MRAGGHGRFRAAAHGDPALAAARLRAYSRIRVDAHTTDFTLKRGGKVVGSVHRVVSADGKTLTVNNKGTHTDGKTYDDTLVFDKQ